MKVIFGLIALMLAMSAVAFAQNSDNAARTADDLRAELHDVQAREAELNAHALQLDEAMKPENIERSLAGVGSTKPEELREFRRKQLSDEKLSVMRQLEQLAARRSRLEAAIQTAETLAYQQSAQGTPLNRLGMTSYMGGSRLLIAGLLGFVAVVALVGIFVVIRRQ